MKDTSRKLLYAADLAIVAEDKEELNESLEEWKEAFKQHELRVNLEKTEVLSIGAHREELNIKLEGRTIRQNNNFIYLGGAVSSDGRIGNRGEKKGASWSKCMEAGRRSHV